MGLYDFSKVDKRNKHNTVGVKMINTCDYSMENTDVYVEKCT